jgi:hypothetical protein
VTTDAEIDEKLARLGRRVQAGRDTVRDELERTGLLGPITAAREAFGARLVWFKSDRLEQGREIPAGVVPMPYQPRRVDGTSKSFLDASHGHAASAPKRPGYKPPRRRKGKAKSAKAAASRPRRLDPMAWIDRS